QRSLVATEELVAVEVAVRERFCNAQCGQPLGRAGRPMIAWHVREAEPSVLKTRHGIRTATVRVGPREQPVHENGRLIAGHGTLAQERTVREARIELHL